MFAVEFFTLYSLFELEKFALLEDCVVTWSLNCVHVFSENIQAGLFLNHILTTFPIHRTDYIYRSNALSVIIILLLNQWD